MSVSRIVLSYRNVLTQMYLPPAIRQKQCGHFSPVHTVCVYYVATSSVLWRNSGGVSAPEPRHGRHTKTKKCRLKDFNRQIQISFKDRDDTGNQSDYSASGAIAPIGQTPAQVPQSRQRLGSIWYTSPSEMAPTGHSLIQVPQATQSVSEIL